MTSAFLVRFANDQHAEERHGVGRRHAEQQAAEELRQGPRSDHTDRQADRGESKRLEDNPAWTSRADAPSAMRIPISCVRWFTEYEIRAIASVKPSVAPSSRTCDSIATETVSRRAGPRVPAIAIASPSTAALHDNTIPSVSICATRRPRPAPSAVRIRLPAPSEPG